jgi:hypothetical protein
MDPVQVISFEALEFNTTILRLAKGGMWIVAGTFFIIVSVRFWNAFAEWRYQRKVQDFSERFLAGQIKRTKRTSARESSQD